MEGISVVCAVPCCTPPFLISSLIVAVDGRLAVRAWLVSLLPCRRLVLAIATAVFKHLAEVLVEDAALGLFGLLS